MIHSLIRRMKGYVRIRVEGYSPERFLNMCCYHGIYIWGLAPAGDAYEMYMSVSGLKKVRPLARKTHTKICIVRRVGLPFFIVRDLRFCLEKSGVSFQGQMDLTIRTSW